MAQSYKEYSGGELSATTYSVPFKYLNIDDVHAIGFDGDKWTVLALHAETPRSIADKTITLAAVPSSYTKIRVYRATATTQLVDFQDGSRLSESDLDTAYQQGLFVSQEMAEDANTAQFAALLEASLQSGTSLSNFASQEMAADGTNGAIDGTNGEFTITAFTPATTVPEAYRVTIDGVMQSPTDAYSVTISPSKITFTSAPPSGSKIVIVTAASAATATSVDNVTIGLTSNNRAQIIDGSITNAKLAGSITQDKLAGGITNDQLAGSIAQDKLDGLSITNAELAGSITEDKLSGSIPQSKLSLDLIDDDTFTTGVSATSLASSESIKAYVDINTNNITTTSGTAPYYGCRAWAKWNGTSGADPVITASGNVESITRNSAGQYTIVFTTAMPTAHYAITTGCSDTFSTYAPTVHVEGDPTATGFVLQVYSLQTSRIADQDHMSFAVFA